MVPWSHLGNKLNVTGKTTKTQIWNQEVLWEFEKKNNGNWFRDHLKQNKTSCNQTPPSTSTTNWTLKPLRKKHPRYALRKKKKVLFFFQQVTFVEFRSNPWSWSKNGMWNSSPGSSMFFLVVFLHGWSRRLTNKNPRFGVSRISYLIPIWSGSVVIDPWPVSDDLLLLDNINSPVVNE